MFLRVGGRYSAAERLMGKGMVRRVPLSLRRMAIERDGLRCTYCGDTDGPFHIDHKRPWSTGGTHDLDNICVACASCNLLKSNIPYEEWEKVYQ
jgi:5-methylcytosine-specific restriction endonuclease McrA